MEEHKCRLCGGTMILSPKGDYEECSNCGIRIKVIKEKKKPAKKTADGEPKDARRETRQAPGNVSDPALAELGVIFTKSAAPQPERASQQLDAEPAEQSVEPQDSSPEQSVAAPAAPPIQSVAAPAAPAEQPAAPPAESLVQSVAAPAEQLAAQPLQSVAAPATPAEQPAAPPEESVPPIVEAQGVPQPAAEDVVEAPAEQPVAPSVIEAPEQTITVSADYGQYGVTPSLGIVVDVPDDQYLTQPEKAGVEDSSDRSASAGEEDDASRVKTGPLSPEDNTVLDETMRKGMALMSQGEMEKAFALFDGIIKDYPSDHRGWWGLLLFYTRNLSGFFSTAAKFAYNKACDLADDKNRGEMIDRYQYGKDRHKRQVAFLKDGLLHKRVMTIDLDGESNQSYLHYKSDRIAGEKGDKKHHFMLYRNGLTNYLEETLRPEGPLKEEFASESPLDENGIFTVMAKNGASDIRQSFWVEFVSDDYAELHICDAYYCSDYEETKTSREPAGNNTEERMNGYVIIAKAELQSLEKKEVDHVTDEFTNRNKSLQEQRVKWRSKGLCQHCGGTFGRFFKKCKSCGRQKDY
jgi:hypothetical protein